MMMKPLTRLSICILTLSTSVLVWGCNPEESSDNERSTQEQKLILGRMDLSGGWARPGSKGGTSAAYLSISNGTATADTIQNVSAQAAAKAEVHESYKGENGISGMRPAPHRVIGPGKDLHLQPGGLHIMLTDLKRDLAAGDSLVVAVTFTRSGTKNIRLPVQTQQ